jgi:hypothetical protein
MPVSVEVRWFGDGQIPEEMLGWFCSSDPKPISDCRVDDYFTCTPEFGLKVRGRVKVELKYLRKEETLESTSLQVSGVLQEWSKWELPLTKPTPQDIHASTAWATLTKDLWMRKYSVVGDQATEASLNWSR